jgi:2'-5' RNA ligase
MDIYKPVFMEIIIHKNMKSEALINYKSMRTFIAIDIPSSQTLQNLYTDLSSNLAGLHVNFSDLQSLHLTLAFLGDTSERQSKAIVDHLNNLTTEHSPFSIDLSGLGIFTKSDLPQIIWVGIKPSEPLSLLCDQINSCIKLENFEPDQRIFTPHLTIGRVKFSKTNHNLGLFIKKYAGFDFGTVPINNFKFYQSILQPAVPIYKPIETFPL